MDLQAAITVNHKGVKDYKCMTCEKALSLEITLKTHEVTHYGVIEYNYITCYKTFSHYSFLRRHKVTHNGVKD